MRLRSPLPLFLALALALQAVPVQAAPTQVVTLDWTEGGPLVGLLGVLEPVDDASAGLVGDQPRHPDEVRLPFSVSPCHRKLKLDLEYQPPGSVEAGPVTISQLFRWNVTVEDAAGQEILTRPPIEDPGLGYSLGILPEAGAYTLELTLLTGAVEHWKVRIRGWEVPGADDPACDVWINEVELNPAGDDAGKEWVEFYNQGDQAVDLSGWSLVGHGGATGLGNASFELPAGTVVPAGGYAVVTLTGDEVLDDVDETVALIHPDGGTLDITPPLDDIGDNDVTNQRSPDGSTNWIQAPGTPGGANPG